MAWGSSDASLDDIKPDESFHNVENGSIVSLVTAVCLAAILFVIVGISASYPAYDGDAHRILWTVMLILIVFALVSMIVIFVMSKVRRSSWIASNEIYRNVGIKCIFTWLCGTVVLVDVVFAFSANIQCMLKHVDEPAFYIYYATVHALYFIYFFTQNSFIQVFRNTRFNRLKLFNFGMLFITLANATIGFSAYVGHHGIYKPVNQTISENSSDAAKESVCYINSEIGNLHDKLKPYFVPCRIEYTLLVAYFVLSFWQSLSISSENLQSALMSNYQTDYRQLTSPCEDAPSPSSYFLASMMPSAPGGVSLSQFSERIRKFIIGYGIVSNVILIIGTWMQVRYKNNIFDSHFSNYLFLFYKIYTLIILTIAFHVLTTRQNQHQRIRKMLMSEYFLICAGACATAVCTFDIVVSWKLKEGIDIAFVLASATTVIDIHYQIILILRLNRTNLSHIDKTLCTFLMLLAIANFLHWISDTFIVVPHFKRERYIKDVYGEEIANFDHYGIFPLLMYFRLISGIELTEFCRRSLRNE